MEVSICAFEALFACLRAFKLTRRNQMLAEFVKKKKKIVAIGTSESLVVAIPI